MLTIVSNITTNMMTDIIPTTTKWLSLPCEKSRLWVLLLCTPKKAAATLLNVSIKLLAWWRIKTFIT